MHVGVTHLTGSHGVAGDTGTARNAVPANTRFVCGGCLGTLPVENVARLVKLEKTRVILFSVVAWASSVRGWHKAKTTFLAVGHIRSNLLIPSVRQSVWPEAIVCISIATRCRR